MNARVLLNLLPSLALASPAGDSSFRQAQADLAALHFDAAVRHAQESVHIGGNEPGRLADLYFILGQASGVLGRTDDSVDAFGRALELSPALTLPAGISPKLGAPYREALERLGGQRFGAHVEAHPLESGRAQVDVDISGDVFRLVDHGVVQVHARAGWTDIPLARTQPLQAFIACPPGECSFVVQLMDPQDNIVLQAGSRAAPLLVPPALVPVAHADNPMEPGPTVTSTPGDTGTAHLARTWPWMAAAAVGAGAGVFFATQYASAEKSFQAIQNNKASNLYATAQSANGTRLRDYGLMWTGFGVAGAAGVVACWVW